MIDVCLYGCIRAYLVIAPYAKYPLSIKVFIRDVSKGFLIFCYFRSIKAPLYAFLRKG